MADWKEQSLQIWRNLGKRQQYMVVGGAVLFFIAILGWSYWWGSKPDMVPLFTRMEAKDAGEVAAKLKEMKINYEPQEMQDGTAILVHAKDVHAARLELATMGLPRGKKGFEIFENTKLGVTEFQNKVNYLQALQGELTRTIEELEEVDKARVHIVLSEDSLYKKNEKPATASIMLKLKKDAQLTKNQVKGIVNLASHSIQGLQAENITVVNSLGKILNDPDEIEENNVSNVTLTQLDMTRKVQDRLQRNVQSLLDQALGEGKAFVRLSVELDFDQRMTDRQEFTPVVDESGIIRSSQDISENYNGTSAVPGGPAGTAANIPGYVAANNTQSQYDKKEVTRNYEVNETKEKVVASPGSIKRLTIGVLVDEQINAMQRESISRAVASAVGLSPNRGDTVSVEALPFSTEMMERQAREEEAQMAQEERAFWIQVGAVVLVLLGIALFIYMRRRKERLEMEEQERVEMEEALEVQRQEEELAAAMADLEDNMSPEEKEQITERQTLEDMIRTRPDEVAQLIRTWLVDE